jgi:metal-responsive CopG/Arc/MetJ family transcriptional regulator
VAKKNTAVRINELEYAELQKVAAAKGENISEIIRRAIRSYISPCQQ